MIAVLHYHAENIACIPLPQLGIVLGYDIPYCTSGLVPNMGSVEVFGEERDGITKQKIDGDTEHEYKQQFEAV